MSSSNCCFLTCIQVSQEAGQVVWYSHLLKNFPQFVVIHIVKGFGIVNKAEDVFLELSCFSYDPLDVGNLISGSSAFSKSILYIWKFSVHILLKPILDFENHLANMWNKHHCTVVWTFFVCMWVLLAQSCPSLCNSMDCSPSGSSVHGILQARILEWVAMPSSKGLNPGLLDLLHWQGGSWPLYTHMTFFRYKKEGNSIICDIMDEPGRHHAMWNKPNRKTQTLHSLAYICRI